MKRRRPLAPESLTSLVDVLFILVFAALVQRAAAAGGELEHPTPPSPSPSPASAAPTWAPPPAMAELRRAAERRVTDELRARPAVVLRVSARGVLTSLEVAPGETGALAALLAPPGAASPPGATAVPGARVALELPLLEKVPDPDVALGYVAERDPQRALCEVAARRLGSLGGALVIVAVDAPLDELMVALVAGLRRDVERCLLEHRAAAVLLDSAATQTAAPGSHQ